MIVIAHVSYCKVLVILVRFERNLNFKLRLKEELGCWQTLGQGQGRAQRGASHLMAFRHLHSDEIKEMWHRQVMAQEKKYICSYGRKRRQAESTWEVEA